MNDESEREAAQRIAAIATGGHVWKANDLVDAIATALRRVRADVTKRHLNAIGNVMQKRSEGPTGCLGDGDELSQALRQVSPQRLNELLAEMRGDSATDRAEHHGPNWLWCERCQAWIETQHECGARYIDRGDHFELVQPAATITDRAELMRAKCVAKVEEMRDQWKGVLEKDVPPSPSRPYTLACVDTAEMIAFTLKAIELKGAE